MIGASERRNNRRRAASLPEHVKSRALPFGALASRNLAGALRGYGTWKIARQSAAPEGG